MRYEVDPRTGFYIFDSQTFREALLTSGLRNRFLAVEELESIVFELNIASIVENISDQEIDPFSIAIRAINIITKTLGRNGINIDGQNFAIRSSLCDYTKPYDFFMGRCKNEITDRNNNVLCQWITDNKAGLQRGEYSQIIYGSGSRVITPEGLPVVSEEIVLTTANFDLGRVRSNLCAYRYWNGGVPQVRLDEKPWTRQK